MSIPKVSVVMSVYKEPLNWIQESIDSILQQTFTDFEFVIINDNPGREELNGFLEANRVIDNRIIIITNEKNIGLTKSLNKGLALAQGDYIARMDADDVSSLERFQKQIAFLTDNPEIGVCGAWLNAFGDFEGVIKYPQSMDDICMFLDSPLAHPVVMFRKEILKGKGYDESFQVSQDYALWARLYMEGVNFYNIPEPLLNYRFNNNQITSKHNSLQQKMGRKIRRELLNYELCRNGYTAVLEERFSLRSIKYLKKVFVFLNKENYSQFLYYTYLSSDISMAGKIFHMIYDLDIFRMRLSNVLRIVYYGFSNKDMTKF